jgi:hypothetical protein
MVTSVVSRYSRVLVICNILLDRDYFYAIVYRSWFLVHFRPAVGVVRSYPSMVLSVAAAEPSVAGAEPSVDGVIRRCCRAIRRWCSYPSLMALATSDSVSTF